MNKLNKNKVGLALATVFGGVHLVWAALIGFGWAQPFMDFIFRIHMINPVVVVSGFSFGLSLALIVITAIIGYVVGYVFSLVWNKLHR